MPQSSPARAATGPFDAVLFLGFGGPEGLDDIRPFLANVLRGRRIPPARIEEVAHHYERFGGVSPITAITDRQARALEGALAARGRALPVHVGTRNWRPLVVDTCRRLHASGARRIPPARIEEVAHHYERFGGVSPITAITDRQARALEGALAARGRALPVHVGTRNWRPLVVDTCRRLHASGARRILVVLAAAHRSYSSCEQYKQNLWQAQEELAAAGIPPLTVAFAGDWHASTGFVDAVVDRIAIARATLPPALRDGARIVFTAHSIPTSMPAVDRYVGQLKESAAAVAARIGTSDWTLVFQSRSGRPEDPWLEPDVNGYLREARAAGLASAILVPIGFLADHIEVLFDLDVEARDTAAEIGLALVRAEAVNDHPRFIEALADAVCGAIDRYGRGRPLSILPAEPPAKRELPPPVRPAAAS